ncbi:MAG: serine/threonine-protein kinase [Gemmatimonadota bacterium]
MAASLVDRLSALPGYTVERELGGGGMSRVFLAEETALNRRVAIKVLEPQEARVDVDRFRREIMLAARLSHPHIVPLLAAGEIDGLLYYVMPFVEGDSLRSRIRTGGPVPIGEAIRILRNVAAALAYAHQHSIIHRDIKPDNIVVPGGIAVVLDFGVSKALAASTAGWNDGLTGAGLAIGTPRYMAPEQVMADPDLDARADLYSWGILAYEILTGATPFGGSDPVLIARAHIAESPAPVGGQRSGIPPAVASLVMRCLEKDRARRPATANELLDLLDAIGTPTGAHGISLGAAATRGWSGAAAALIPTALYLIASACTVGGLHYLGAQGQIGPRFGVLSLVGALLGLPIVVGLGLVSGLRQQETGDRR